MYQQLHATFLLVVDMGLKVSSLLNELSLVAY